MARASGFKTRLQHVYATDEATDIVRAVFDKLAVAGPERNGESVSHLIADWWHAREVPTLKVIATDTSPEERHDALVTLAADALRLAIQLQGVRA
jgi:hypothetical protein